MKFLNTCFDISLFAFGSKGCPNITSKMVASSDLLGLKQIASHASLT